MDFSDRLNDLETQALQNQALLIYLQSEIEVLRSVCCCLLRDSRIGDKTVDEFCHELLAKRIHHALSHIADSNPRLATALEKILRDAEKRQIS